MHYKLGKRSPTASARGRTAFAAALESTLHRAIANQRRHEYATLERLLLALIDDLDASAVMKACKVDLGGLQEPLVS
jgi:ATP-dependent Clp protease ATP-binding subunit ClpA